MSTSAAENPMLPQRFSPPKAPYFGDASTGHANLSAVARVDRDLNAYRKPLSELAKISGQTMHWRDTWSLSLTELLCGLWRHHVRRPSPTSRFRRHVALIMNNHVPRLQMMNNHVPRLQTARCDGLLKLSLSRDPSRRSFRRFNQNTFE